MVARFAKRVEGGDVARTGVSGRERLDIDVAGLERFVKSEDLAVRVAVEGEVKLDMETVTPRWVGTPEGLPVSVAVEVEASAFRFNVLSINAGEEGTFKSRSDNSDVSESVEVDSLYLAFD